MKIYGLNLVNNARVTNTVVPSGTAFPTNGIGQGTIFYKVNNTSEDGLYLYFNSNWKLVSTSSVTTTANVNNDLLMQVTSPIAGQQLQYDGTKWTNEFAPGLSRKVVTSTYTATLQDTYLGVQHNNSLSIYLPPGALDKLIIIKDERGMANSKNINIIPNGNQTIYYKSSYQMTAKADCIWLLFGSDNNWNIINK